MTDGGNNMPREHPAEGSEMVRLILAVAIGMALSVTVAMSLATSLAKSDDQSARNAAWLAPVAASDRLLQYNTQRLAPGAAERLAMRAVRQSPFADDALVHLARVAEARGDEATAQFWFDRAGALGWQNGTVQRLLYNWAVSGDDNAIALRHAEALLRTGRARADLAADFRRRTRDTTPAARDFSAKLEQALSLDQPWAAGLVIAHNDALPTAMLQRLVAQPDTPRPVATALFALFLRDERPDAAAGIARSLGAVRGAAPLPQWDETAGAGTPDPFKWIMPDGYATAFTDGQARLARLDIALPPGNTREVSLLLALEPGAYRLQAGNADENDGWRWRVICAASGDNEEPRALGAANTFRVAPDCPLQQLALSAPSRAAQGEGLPAMAILRDGAVR